MGYLVIITDRSVFDIYGCFVITQTKCQLCSPFPDSHTVTLYLAMLCKLTAHVHAFCVCTVHVQY